MPIGVEGKLGENQGFPEIKIAEDPERFGK
jgi:hypothetical protein